uniref:Ribosomal protein L19 n=2 Tax=Gracilariopsis TaxID=2781 RepID=A0A1C9CF40_9FLOR|nr:ribosomal protein L19 [Gracilariopsis lemaneiformis]YP_009294760.1 ribosomal protein L19 [Gracilariopsis chorda]AJO68401.1 ribosomal protein L19 [Gracilariopsis lemaneiformis]AML79883.1 ribosomal protein L19 [Gracilariopsis lemaneiformis]AOM67020.1 ribosomal protein L19 [Gracilariopsis chorda]UAD88921.1 ribosomal protein L19 [Gracilariopsis chorda]
MYLKTNKKQLIISQLEKKFQKIEIPIINIGDSIKMGILIQEGSKERIQNVEGVVISKHNSQLNTTITIRKVLQNIGVERVYLIHSPRIKTIQIVKRAKIRRAKLYYLRSRSGKATRLKQKFH